jgi:hypothetical protein
LRSIIVDSFRSSRGEDLLDISFNALRKYHVYGAKNKTKWNPFRTLFGLKKESEKLSPFVQLDVRLSVLIESLLTLQGLVMTSSAESLIS